MKALDRFKYTSRKIIRWFGGIFILTGGLAALLLAVRVSPLLALGATAFALLLLALGLRAKSGPLAAMTDILIAYAATLQGVMRAMSGRTVTVWNPAKSR